MSTAALWTAELHKRAHRTIKVPLCAYPRRTLQSPGGSAQCLKTETQQCFCFLLSLSPEWEMDAETIIQLRKSRGFIMIPIYPSLSSSKWQPGPTDKYRQSTLAHSHINTLADRRKIMHFLADSQSESDDSNQFLDTNRASNPLMVLRKWTLRDGRLAVAFGFLPCRS